jgi:rhodanese-related sulfurtransferase
VPTPIFRDEVRALLEEGAQLVDVLPREEYEDDHLPMQARGASAVLVTTSDGRLVGLLYRKDAERPAGVRP